MPHLTLKQVEHVALLARLELTPDEKQRLQSDLNSILDHFQRLQELDTSAIEPMTHAIPMTNVFREDVARPSLPVGEVLAAAPEAREECFVVPRIVET